jgi:spore coat polysaccharide biosynthesis protein SpsF (cytidylyltransferase family)
MGSKRLPGKVLLPLNGHTVIGEVLSRCWKIPGVNKVVCAIPEADNDLAAEARKYANVCRGSEDDVLSRYHVAAVATDADIIVRVTGDCPLICPELCGDIIAMRAETGADYASNVHPRTFPQGYDCEVFTFSALNQAYRHSVEREHVTTWMLLPESCMKRVNYTSPWPLEGRLTLDTYDDYNVISAYFSDETRKHLRAA